MATSSVQRTGVAMWAFLACIACSGSALAVASTATEVRLSERDTIGVSSWNDEDLEADVSSWTDEDLEADVCLLQLDVRSRQKLLVQRLDNGSKLKLPKVAQGIRRLDSIRSVIGAFVFCVVFALASLAAARGSYGATTKRQPTKDVVEGYSSQEPKALAPPAADQGTEYKDISVRFHFVSKLLEEKLGAREVSVSGPNSNNLYGLYMQATCGDVRGRRPWVLRPKDRAKWDSWATQRGQSTAAAMAKYVETACDVMQGVKEIEGINRADECPQREQSGDLQKRFDKAASDLEEKMRKGELNIPAADLIAVYGLYKQATCGDNHGGQPWAYNVKARAKWDSWAALKGMAQSEAMEKYIGDATGLLTAQ